MLKNKAALFIIMVIGLSSCMMEIAELPPFKWEGEYVKFATNDELPCEEELLKLDKIAADIAVFFEKPITEKIKYYLLDKADIKQWCPSDAGACAKKGIVYTPYMSDIHELAHAVGAYGFHSFFNEGLASAIDIEVIILSYFSYFYEWNSISNEPRLELYVMGDAIDEIIDNPKESITIYGYGVAAVFTYYLLNEFGKEKTLGLMAKSSKNWERKDFNEHFQKDLGKSFDEVLEDFAKNDDFCYSTLLSPEITIWWENETFAFGEALLDYIICSNDSKASSVYVNLLDEQAFEIPERGVYKICILEPGQTECELLPYFEPQEPEEVRAFMEKNPEEYHKFQDSIWNIISEEKGYFDVERLFQFGPGCLRNHSVSFHSQIGFFLKGVPIGKEVALKLNPGIYTLQGIINDSLYQQTQSLEIQIEKCREGEAPEDDECELSKDVLCENECRFCFFDEENDCKMCECVEY